MILGSPQGLPQVADTLTCVRRLIESDLEHVERLILAELADEHAFVGEVMRYGFRLGGKRLRPVLVLLCGRVFGPLTPDHYRTAAVLEIIHTATLIHDDILDGAEFRRHLETVNLRWDSGVGVLAGDLLFSRALKLATGSEDLFSYRCITEAMRRTCEAELKQVAARGRFNLTRGEYYEIISGKTAALLSCACRLGTYFSGVDEEIRECFTRFGEQLGQAFQIIDDILDLVGEEQIVGKTLGTDLHEGKATLPLIYFFETASGKECQTMRTLLDCPEQSQVSTCEIAGILRQSGAVDAARNIASEKIEAAIHEIERLDSSVVVPESREFLDGLFEIARFVTDRKR